MCMNSPLQSYMMIFIIIFFFWLLLLLIWIWSCVLRTSLKWHSCFSLSLSFSCVKSRIETNFQTQVWSLESHICNLCTHTHTHTHTKVIISCLFVCLLPKIQCKLWWVYGGYVSILWWVMWMFCMLQCHKFIISWNFNRICAKIVKYYVRVKFMGFKV